MMQPEDLNRSQINVIIQDDKLIEDFVDRDNHNNTVIINENYNLDKDSNSPRKMPVLSNLLSTN